MCMIEDGEKILVLNRTKTDWPGLTFPGGHVENDEDFAQSVIREVKEETGLTITHPILVDKYIWIDENKNTEEVALLYKTNNFEGQILSSREGEVFFINKKDINNYALSNDFDKILIIYLGRDIFTNKL